MCLIAWNWQPEQPQRLLLIANRDEYRARAALPLHWWGDADVLAGRDAQANGTWLGVNRHGRMAALTNFRSGTAQRTDAPSRGQLIPAYLQSALSAPDFLDAINNKIDNYNPFNLLVFDGKTLMGLESRQRRVVTFTPGVGAVSNADFHTPWPKLRRWREQLERQFETSRITDADLLPLLQDTTLAPDDQLPHTGIGLDFERALSAPFVTLPHYGTRVSSVVRLGAEHHSFVEVSYPDTTPASAQQHRIAWSSEHTPASR